MRTIKKFLKRLPRPYVIIFKKVYYRYKISKNTFISEEKEFDLIDKVVGEGDRVIDIGANVGHYTLKLSKLVGREGRVLAFEPIPETFEMLASNVGYSAKDNVTLINGAVSTVVMETKFSVPKENLYLSHMDESGDIGVVAFPLAIFIPDDWNLTFIKIDAEGCDESIVNSSVDVINKFRPIVMLEVNQGVAESLSHNIDRYCVLGKPGSHNKFLVPNEKRGLVSFLS